MDKQLELPRMENSVDSGKPRHPIQVAARRSGLTQDVIRAWERRYSAVEPGRSATNRRLYSDDDVEKLLLLARATAAGRRIGEVASLTPRELRGLVEADREAEMRVGNSRSRTRRGARSGDHLAACMAAIENLDPDALDSALQSATVDLSGPMLMERLLMPMMHEVGERWQHGTLRVAHEHMATALVRTFLGSRGNVARPAGSDPEIVVATPAGQLHELGALMVAVTAASGGWRVTYLGPNLPAEEIAAAAKSRRPRAVALSIVYPGDDPRLPEDLRRLAAQLDDGVALLVGGASSSSYADVLREIDARVLRDVDALSSTLQELRGLPPVT
jgi:methanogenic corrinoid protein MtbC1